MADRVSSDHQSVKTYRATIKRDGSTRRPVISLHTENPPELSAQAIVRVEINETEYFSYITNQNNTPVFRGAFENARLAKTRSASGNYLLGWIAKHDQLGFNRTVLVDEVVPEFRYGFRVPGQRTTYSTSTPPASSLQDIARSLGEN